MSAYATAPDVPPVRIDTFRPMRKRHKQGELHGDEPGLSDDFFLSTTPQEQPAR